jgi:hypothetical protein
MRYLLVSFVCFCLTGCLPSAATDDEDGSASIVDGGFDPGDLAGADLAGFLNCAALDKAEAECDPLNSTCYMELRLMATPGAIQKDQALQQCFHAQCPLNAVCMPDGNGKYTVACLTCVANTLKASPTDCTPPSTKECTKCYNQGQTCLND